MGKTKIIATILGVAGSIAVGIGTHTILTIGSCGPRYLTACPDEALPHLIAFMVGLSVAIIAAVMGGRFALISLPLAVGLGSLWAGFQAPPGEKVFPYLFGAGFVLFDLPLMIFVLLLLRKRAQTSKGRSQFVVETKVGNLDSPEARQLFEWVAGGPSANHGPGVSSQQLFEWVAGGPSRGPEVPEQQPHADPLDRLAKLHQLRMSGALTEEEFQAQKARLLYG